MVLPGGSGHAFGGGFRCLAGIFKMHMPDNGLFPFCCIDFLARSHRFGVGKISLFTSDFFLFLILIFEPELEASKIVAYYDQLR